jgi:hypothetical protein
MEHRWGKRSPVDLAATLHLSCGTAVCVRVANVSLSGALVLTEARIPVFSQVIVELELGGQRQPRTQLVPGYIARQARGGLGLEWNEFSPSAIADLRRRDAARLAADVEPNLQHNSRPRPSFAGGLFESRLWR